MTPKNIILSLGAAVLIVAGLYGAWRATSGPQGQSSYSIKATKEDNVRGATNSATVIIEYADFQCPACKAYHPLLQQLEKTFEKQVTFIYRHFPLSGHKNAYPAAYAAQAAGLQGKFWEMHDLLFAGQSDWAESGNPQEIFVSYAKELKLDTKKFVQDMKGDAVKKRVERDVTTGNQYSVNSTPTFFLNGKKIDNPRSLQQFKKIIQEAISE